MQKNNTRDSNVVPHRSTNLARQCLTSLSRREAVLSLWYGRSCFPSECLPNQAALTYYTLNDIKGRAPMSARTPLIGYLLELLLGS